MRDIRFRGKRIDNGEWVYGDLVCHYENQRRFITCDQMAYTYTECGIDRLVSERFCEVNPETVGQYTGLKDKNGTEIYEGDIVNRRSGEYWQGCYEFDDTITISDLMDIVTTAEFESLLVIDNIHNNPELLGGAE